MRHRKVLLAIRRSQSRTEYAIDLQRGGFDVETADDGVNCLAVLEHFVPDVIVLEPELLWGGGDGVLAVLRDIAELRDIPALVLTTDFNRTALFSISQFPVSDFRVQPISSERLTKCVRRLADDFSRLPPYLHVDTPQVVGARSAMDLSTQQFRPLHPK